MVQKQIDTKKSLHSFEALMLYIDLLYSQARHTSSRTCNDVLIGQGLGEKILELLESDWSHRVCKQPFELKTFKGQCCLQLRDYQKAELALHDSLSEDPDHWTCFCCLLDIYLPPKKAEEAKAQVAWQSVCRETCQPVQNPKRSDRLKSEEGRSVDIEKG